MVKVPGYGDWLHANVNEFWGDIAHSDHVVQFYENDKVYYNTLAGFVQQTISSNENVMVIASEPHLNGLEHRLEESVLNIDDLISDTQFIPLDVEEVISEFTIDGEFDESRLNETLASLYVKAGYNKKRFRLCGEIAPALLAHGYTEIAKRVEHLTEIANRENGVCVYCLYAVSMFGFDSMNLAKSIRDKHSRMISGSEEQLPHLLYTNIVKNAS